MSDPNLTRTLGRAFREALDRIETETPSVVMAALAARADRARRGVGIGQQHRKGSRT